MRSVEERMGIKRLSETAIGSCVRVAEVEDHGRITQRMMEMGVVPGVMITVIKSAPFGDPIEIRLKGYHLAIRKNEAEMVSVIS